MKIVNCLAWNLDFFKIRKIVASLPFYSNSQHWICVCNLVCLIDETNESSERVADNHRLCTTPLWRLSEVSEDYFLQSNIAEIHVVIYIQEN